MRLFIFLSCFLLFVIHRANGWGVYRGSKFHTLRILGEKYKLAKYFTQNLDHFNPNDERTWQQRYFVNEDYVNGTARKIAFLFIGGEGEESGRDLSYGFMAEYAQELKAICFSLEHRYYGQSRPTKDMSTRNLQYLTSEQALADLAFFVQAMNVQYELSPDVQWIAIGGSYAGNLAAWIRLKYPHLIKGAMSASGPLLAQLDFPEYLEVVTNDLKRDSHACWEAFQRGYLQLKNAIFNPTSYGIVDELFYLCDPLADRVNNPLDMSNLFELIVDGLASVAQYDSEKPMSHAQYGVSIKSVCDIMKDESRGSEMARLAAVNSEIRYTSSRRCFDYKYDTVIRNIQNISWDSVGDGMRQWTYQTCTEFGYYQTSTKAFGNEIPLDFFIQQCIDSFGPKFDKAFVQKAVKRTNSFYGGLDIDVSNVVFVHGSSDPWHVLGITQTRNIASPAILIDGVAHCAVMNPSSASDYPQMKEARRQIKQLIGSWLKL